MEEADKGPAFHRVRLPNQMRCCVPCSPDSNSCVDPCCPAKLRPRGPLVWPENEVVKQRISAQEWALFIEALDTADRKAAIPCHHICLDSPLWIFQPFCCFLPYLVQYRELAIRRTNAYEVLAKYNRYLFMPRGLLVRYQHIYDEELDGLIYQLRIDIMPSEAPIQHEMLDPNMALGKPPEDFYNTRLAPWCCACCECLAPKVNTYLQASDEETRDDELEKALQRLNA